MKCSPVCWMRAYVRWLFKDLNDCVTVYSATDVTFCCSVFIFLIGFPQLNFFFSLWLFPLFIFFLASRTSVFFLVCVDRTIFIHFKNHRDLWWWIIKYPLIQQLNNIHFDSLSEAGSSMKRIFQPQSNKPLEKEIRCFHQVLNKHCLLVMSNVQGYYFFLSQKSSVSEDYGKKFHSKKS